MRLCQSEALPSLKEYDIITNYCLGAINEVKTVLLLSNKEIDEIKSVGLDSESATSVRLAKVLAKHYWNISPEWQALNVRNYTDYPGTDAFVVIGDKAIELSTQFIHKKDLALAWQNFTGLPFVFAVWVCRKDLPKEQLKDFSSALQYGIEHLSDVVKKYKSSVAPDFNLASYYRDNIDYHFDELKKTSLQKFLNFVSDIE